MAIQGWNSSKSNLLILLWKLSGEARKIKWHCLLRNLTTHATIYHLWKQRNNVIHNLTSIPPAAVFRGTDREMKNTITSRKHKKHFSSLMALWVR
ncbi:unnamed protein product [Brassica oleracea]